MQIRTRCNQQFYNFPVASLSRTMQRSRSVLTLCIHVNPFIQFRLDANKIAFLNGIVNRISDGRCGQQPGCDCCE